jgi:two-component system CheB/CheR fusion protein
VERSFCVAGIGASAGGLDAYRQLFAALPADTGMGFVVIQHLSPTHDSNLAEILSRSTSMPVVEVNDEPTVEPNHVYVIPPAKTMVMTGGHLSLRPRAPKAPSLPVDVFFHSLAEDRGHRAVGIVLSGTGSDGTGGLKEIKAAGGITFAQDGSAQQDGMPRSAVAAGCVDFVLPPAQIAQEIARIAGHTYVASAQEESVPQKEDSDRGRVLQLLHQHSGIDFAQYKASTLNRRISRRMLLHRHEKFAEYAALLRERPGEVEALFQDILIGVTGFFRDRETFDALEREVFPRLLAQRERDAPLRIWVLGCSTGEEAYSYAILAAELAGDSSAPAPVQVFATDLNPSSIDKARAGIYPKSIAQDVSESRLRRFFAEVDGSYRISKSIRDLCVFARHNALVDPPFSRVDIISCRNVLIYLEAPLQKKLLTRLHYALKPSAFLVLGNSETIGAYRNLFDALDGKHKIYRKEGGSGQLTLPPRAAAHAPQGAAARPGEKPAPIRPDALTEADRILLARYAPSAVLVNAELEILQFRGETSAYLAPASGKASLNLLKMAREGVATPLRGAILKARKMDAAVRQEGVKFRSAGAERVINLEILPVRGASAREGGFLVLFEDAAGKDARAAATAPQKRKAARASSGTSDASAAEELAGMAQELAATREYLQSVIEQQEAANEELQSTNEEAQSANEELQSINEELETSKEEIQSSNEELATVNDELQNRNEEFNRVNNDLVNFIGSMDTAMVMVGPDLRIRRYSPLAEKSFNLIPADLGRPITDINLGVSPPELAPLLAEVMDSATDREREIRNARGQWFLLRVRPYRTLDNKIDGAVLILVDIDTLKRAREFAENIVATVREPLLVLDADFRVLRANQSFCALFRLAPADAEGRPLHELAQGAWDDPAVLGVLHGALGEKGAEDVELERDFPLAGRLTLRMNAKRLVQEAGSPPLLLLGMQNLTERRKLRETLRQVAQLSEVDRNRNEFLAMLAHELRNPLAPLRNSIEVLKSTGADEKARERAREMMERQLANMTRLVDDLLDSARVTQGKIELVREPVLLPALLDRVALSVQPQIDFRKQVLTLSMLPDPIYVNADSTRLEQAFGNLLHNASKFSPVAAQISLTMELAPERPGQDGPADILVRVRDSGAGISADALPHVFELFMQSDRSLDRTQGGLGIGLTLTRKLIELHGGSIQAFSEGLGKGSELVVRLPVLRSESFKASQQRPIQRTEAEFKRSILIVDDNIDAAESLAAILRLAGHKAATAYTASGALQMTAETRPDAVVLDIGLPEMDGYELARRLREQPHLAGILLIALTGYGSDDDRERARLAGLDHHFTKPVDYRQLEKVLERPPGGRG